MWKEVMARIGKKSKEISEDRVKEDELQHTPAASSNEDELEMNELLRVSPLQRIGRNEVTCG